MINTYSALKYGSLSQAPRNKFLFSNDEGLFMHAQGARVHTHTHTHTHKKVGF